MAGELEFDAWINNSDFKRQIDEMNRRLVGLSTTADTEGKKIQDSFSKVGHYIQSAFAGAAIQQFIQQVVTVRGEFQQLEIGMRTMLGSKEKADKLMSQVVDLAAKTPFTLTEVGAGAKQLLAYQVSANEVVDTLKRLGDVSSGLGVPINRLILAYGQVKAKGKLQGDDMRQFTEAGVPIIHELAKSMGVADAQISKMVETGKVGFPEVQKVIQNLTNQGGMFYNLMEQNSKSLTGMVSNLHDAWDRMLNSIGKDTEGVLGGTIQVGTDLLNNYQQVLKVIEALIATYGTYRAALVLSNIANGMAVASSFGVTSAEYIQAKATMALAEAQAFLNKTVLANPYVAAATLLVGLGTLMWALHDSTTATERAQREYNASLEIQAKKEADLKTVTDSNLQTVQNKSLADKDRLESLQKLRVEYPKIFEKYKTEESVLKNILVIIKQINEEQSKRTVEAKTISLEEQRTIVSNLEKQKERIKSQNGGNFDDRNLPRLAIEQDKLRMMEEKALKERASSYISNLKNVSDAKIKAEIKDRERLLFELSKPENKDKKYGEVRSGGAKGIFTRDELEAQKQALEGALIERVDKKDNATVIAKLKKDISDTESELKKLRGLNAISDETEIGNAEAKLKGLKASLQTLTGEKPKKSKTEIENFEAELKAKKTAYDFYSNSVHQDGIDKANITFAHLMTLGNDYEAYLNNQKNAIISKAGGKPLSKSDQNRVNILNSQIDTENRNKTGIVGFEAELSGIKRNAKDAYEALDLLNKKQKELEGGKYKNMDSKDTDLAKAKLDSQKSETLKSITDDLEKYQTYENERAKITADAQERITFLTSKGEKERADLVAKERDDKLAKLDLTKFDTENKTILDKVFGSLDNLSGQAIYDLIDKVREKIRLLSAEAQKSDDVKALLKSLTDIEDKTKSSNKNPFTKLTGAISNYKDAKTTDDIAKELGAKPERLAETGAAVKKSVKEVAGAVGELAQFGGGVFNSVVDGMKKLGIAGDEETQKLLGNVSGMIEGASTLATGIASGNPLQIVQGTIGLITNGIQAFDSKNRALNRDIKAHQEEIKKLSIAYEELSRAAEKALGTDYYTKQKEAVANLEKQKREMEAIARDEKSKSGKNKDQAKIDEADKAVRDIQIKIEDGKQKIVDDLLQTNIRDFAKSVSDSLVDAFLSGESAAKAFDKVVNNMMLNLVKNMINKTLVEKAMQPMLAYLQVAMADYNLSEDEYKTAMGMADTAKKIVMDGVNSLDKLLKNFSEDGQANGLSGAIKGVTQETASLLAGQITAMRLNQALGLDIANDQLIMLRLIASSVVGGNVDVTAISNTEGLRISRAQLSSLQEIASNTSYNFHLAEIRDLLKTQNANQSANNLYDPLRATGLDTNGRSSGGRR